jgi:hypothetical protein
MQPGPLVKPAAAPRYLRVKGVARPNEGEGSQLLQDTPSKKQWLGFAHLFRPTYPDFLHGAPPTPACAAFIKESRMKCANASKLHRKSGVRLGERGAPVLSSWLSREPELAGRDLWYPTSREKRARYGAPRGSLQGLGLVNPALWYPRVLRRIRSGSI